MMEHKQDCLVCGEPLEYGSVPRKMHCMICGGAFESNVACQRGHYICDVCHGQKGVELIVQVCANTTSRNPIAVMQQLMAQPSIHMHGPEHHVLVGAALLAAYGNCGGAVELEQVLPEMARRGQQVPGGVCGLWGCCGAAISSGIFVSLITGATPLKREEWGLSNQMTAQALQSIGALGGPRCCKRDSFTAVREAVAFVNEHFAIQMELPDPVVCTFSPLNEQCKKEQCPYYRQ